MASFTDRMIGAARLEVHTYEEVEADRSATSQAMGVVLLSSLAVGIGSLSLGAGGLGGFVAGGIGALVGWVAWAFLTYIIGTRMLPEPQTHAGLGEMMRDPGVCPVTGSLAYLREHPGSWSSRPGHRFDLDAGRDGDCRASSAGLHEHLAGGGCVPCGVGGFERHCRCRPDHLRICP